MRSPFPISLLALSALTVSCEDNETPSELPQTRLAPISVLEVQSSSSYLVEERFIGEVESRRTSQLAFELSGTIDVVNFDEGQSVAAGTTVASIDTQRLLSRKVELEAARDQARASLDLAESTAERDERLAADNAISELQLEQSRASLATAQADLARNEAQIHSIEVDLRKSRLVAPFDGIVAHRHVDEGTVVSPGSPVLELVESGALEVRVALARDAVADLEEGDQLAVEFATGKTPTLTVDRILPLRDPITRSVDVILSLPSDIAFSIRDGDLVTVVRGREIAERGFFLPRDALTESSRGLWACFVATGKDAEMSMDSARMLDRRDLEILHEYSDVVYVRGGIGDGDWVMSAGLQKVAPGQNVTVSAVKQAAAGPTLLGFRN